jgi:hypothetical protein
MYVPNLVVFDCFLLLRFLNWFLLIYCISSFQYQIADRRILELEASRDLSRIWLHVDMDAFYAAVETLSNPTLKGKPMAVGSMSMISTANYEVGCVNIL